MRLTFLSWAYPPMAFPRAVQVERLAREGTIRPLDIVCSDAARAEHKAQDAEFTVRRVADPGRAGLLTRLGLGRLRAALAQPDAQRAWAFAAAREIAQSWPPAAGDVLVTFGQPMSDHLAGLALKRRFGMRWIAHFSDPWADNPFATRLPFFRLRNLGLERTVIEAADHVLLTSEETVELVMRKYPLVWRAKASVLPHAFEARLYPPRAAASGPIVLRYLGSLYGKRSPMPFLRGVQSLARRAPDLAARLKIEFIGETAPRLVASAARAALPPGLVRFLPTIDYRSALAAMRSADILVHLDAPAESSVFLASKLVDYVGARRPIVGVTPAGTAAKLIAALGGWVADPASADSIAAALEDAVAYVERSRDADWGDESVRRRYDSATATASFAQIVEQVCGKGILSWRAASRQDA